MQLSHSPSEISAVFDDPNLVSCGGLAPVVALAQGCGLAELVAAKLTLPAKGGVNAHLKIPGLVAGMVAGADSIDDMDLLRHGGMDRLFVACGPRRRWGHSCARSPSVMSASSTVWPRRCWPSWPAAPRCWPVRTSSPTSMSMTP